MTVSELVQRAIKMVGSEAKLGALCGCSQNAIWLAKRQGRISAELALGIHRATDGLVPASSLRPDLWAAAEHVPIEPRQPEGAGATAS